MVPIQQPKLLYSTHSGVTCQPILRMDSDGDIYSTNGELIVAQTLSSNHATGNDAVESRGRKRNVPNVATCIAPAPIDHRLPRGATCKCWNRPDRAIVGQAKIERDPTSGLV